MATTEEQTGGDGSTARLPPDLRRASVIAVARALLVSAVLFGIYMLVPMRRIAEVNPAVTLTLALIGFVTLMAIQIVAITRSPLPGIRAIEALGTTVPLLMVIFASVYWVMSVRDPSTFSEPLSRLDAMYFTVTVFATVGFGDIVARSDAARGAVTVHMVTNLLVIGVGLRLILGAARRARGRTDDTTPTDHF